MLMNIVTSGVHQEEAKFFNQWDIIYIWDSTTHILIQLSTTQHITQKLLPIFVLAVHIAFIVEYIGHLIKEDTLF